MLYDKVAAMLTVRDIASDLPRIDSKCTINDATEEMSFGPDVVGIVVEDNDDIGYVDLSVEWDNPNANVKSWMQPIPSNQIVSESLPIADLAALFATHYFYFVLRRNRVTGIVSYLDLDKIPFKLAFFSMLMGFESALVTGIRRGEKGIRHYLHLLSDQRRAKAIEILALRRQFGSREDSRPEDDQLLDSTCFADRAAIWLKAPDLSVALVGQSKREVRRFMKRVETVRNQIAHGNSVVEVFREPADLILFMQDLAKQTEACVAIG